jgi:hypothetical protein
MKCGEIVDKFSMAYFQFPVFAQGEIIKTDNSHYRNIILDNANYLACI